MNDLEHETQVYMFNTYVLKVEPGKLDNAGYHCLRNFFETINLVERKLKRISASYQSLVCVCGLTRISVVCELLLLLLVGGESRPYRTGLFVAGKDCGIFLSVYTIHND